MIFFIAASTSGVSMDMHFCQGAIKRVSFIGKAMTCQEVLACMKKCGLSEATITSKKCKKSEKGCCHNESVQLDLDFDNLFINAEFLLKKIEAIHIANLSIISKHQDKSKSDFSKRYKPPLIQCLQLFKAHQVYRL